MREVLKIDLTGVNVRNNKVSFEKDKLGRPYMSLIFNRDMTDDGFYFYLMCEMPKGLSVKHKEAEDILSEVKSKLISKGTLCKISFEENESQEAIIVIGAIYPISSEKAYLSGIAMLIDMNNALKDMRQLCRDYVINKLKA